MKESLVNESLLRPFPTVQWGKEQNRINLCQSPSQGLQPARVPWEGPRH
jgi:hypothetical protein